MKTCKIILAGLLLVAAAPALAERSVDITKAAKPTGEVRVSNVSGSITVTGWNKPTVHITGKLGDDVERLQVDTDNNSVEIRVILPRGHDHYRNDNYYRGRNSYRDADAELTIYVPVGSSVNVDTVSADIVAGNLSGSQQLESVSGDVKLDSSSGDISAKSVSGDVAVHGSAKSAIVEAHTISGSVQVSDVNGDLRAASVSGDARVTDSILKRAKLSSTSGNLSFRGSFQEGGKYAFSNVSGDIKLMFHGEPDARFDINTFSGNIQNEFGPKPERNSEYSPGEQLHFASGNGSSQVNINTMSGDVIIEK